MSADAEGSGTRGAARVEVSHGRLRGDRRRGVSSFRRIPFAAPPVGPLRFQAPAPVEPWAGWRDATRVGPGAPQLSGLPRQIAGMFGNPAAGAEDCLTLDVFTPACDGARRPVLVWIHGGAFVMGSGGAAIYDGSALARRGDVVVVSIQYRLGALGFLQMRDVAPEGPFASNPGLRDQIAALRWVREHISEFGGDPSCVTVFGESAGAMSVGTLLASPEARGLFHRAILQSGAAHNVSSRDGAAKVAEAFLEAAELTPATADRLLERPVAELLQIQRRVLTKLTLRHPGLPFQPAADGLLLPETALSAIEAGAGGDVPVLVGTNRDEWNLFLLADRKARNLDEAGLRRRFARALPEAEIDAADALYREAWPDRGPRARWRAFQTDRIFRAPAERLVGLRNARGASTWRYLFTWGPAAARRRVGAAHAVEIPLVFGTWRHPIARPLYLGARALSGRMQERWIAFAREGDPGAGFAGDEVGGLHVFGPRDAHAEAAFETVREFWAARGYGDTA